MDYSLVSTVKKAGSHLGRSMVLGLGLLLLLPGSVVAETKVVVDEVVKQALEATPDRERGKQLYFNCALCHTPEGWGSPAPQNGLPAHRGTRGGT